MLWYFSPDESPVEIQHLSETNHLHIAATSRAHLQQLWSIDLNKHWFSWNQDSIDSHQYGSNMHKEPTSTHARLSSICRNEFLYHGPQSLEVAQSRHPLLLNPFRNTVLTSIWCNFQLAIEARAMTDLIEACLAMGENMSS